MSASQLAASRASDPHGANGPFHDGEKALQSRVGVRERAEQGGRRMIRDRMPEQHREMFAKLPMILVGSLDGQRRPWASVLTGRPGFLASPDDRTLRIESLPFEGDPLQANLTVLAPLGLLGLEPATRRRNRTNGSVVALDERGFTVQVEQSFGNCPQYITPREPSWARPAGEKPAASPSLLGSLLPRAAQDLVNRSDTFFIASASPEARAGGGPHGVDVSHRGIEPGALRLGEEGGAHVLTVPDFRGNSMFNTLGNILVYPRAGLLFVDPGSGDTLQLTCAVEIVWDSPDLAAFPGAQRLLRFRIEEGRFTLGASPLRWSPV